MLITAESCTGGMIGASCTQLAGSSAWFFGGLISYDNLAKERMLKVTSSSLQAFGAVSTEVVEQMCSGALSYGADISVAVSGVAGPGGGSEEKPVGTVYIGWLTKDQAAQGQAAKVQRFQFPGDRDAVRELTLVNAIQGIFDLK
ncbi:damage-inducible protein CinA [Marinomonas sp. 42_23_T18]|nr:damage-inducible protein CinA [Marinomonas sp. 42_23_T18]